MSMETTFHFTDKLWTDIMTIPESDLFTNFFKMKLGSFEQYSTYMVCGVYHVMK